MAIFRDHFRWPYDKRAAVSLTFDDAHASQLDVAMPILHRFDTRATFYVAPKHARARIDDWRRVATIGAHEIGNHTYSHPCSGNFQFTRDNALEDYTMERIEEDIARADDFIAREMGLRATEAGAGNAATFAYPCGQTFVGRGEGVRSFVPLIARRFRVGRAYNSDDHNDPSFCDLAQAFAMDVDGKTFADLRPRLEKVAAEGGWLVLVGHAVAARPAHADINAPRETIWTETLEQLCAYCADPANGLWIDTVKTIGEYIAKARGEQ